MRNGLTIEVSDFHSGLFQMLFARPPPVAHGRGLFELFLKRWHLVKDGRWWAENGRGLPLPLCLLTASGGGGTGCAILCVCVCAHRKLVL